MEGGILDTRLYENVVGPAWAELHPAVYKAHLNGGDELQAHAVFTIRHGQNPLARFAAWLGRLPAQAEAAPVRLAVRRVANGERWERIFPNTRLVSTQYHAGDGLMGERFGLMEIRFRMSVSGQRLVYTQEAAYLTLGPLRLRIPKTLAVQVSASEGVGADGVSPHTSVSVSAPLVGLLVSYEGDLKPEDAAWSK